MPRTNTIANTKVVLNGNEYVVITFIQPTQRLCEQGVRVKLSAVKDIVDGKNIILVDYSIVRGTTTIRRICENVKRFWCK